MAQRDGKQVRRIAMARRPKEAPQQREQSLSPWVQGLAIAWMIGTLVWFFTDFKIQQWLVMMLADLLRR
jgi:hypothetical protein